MKLNLICITNCILNESVKLYFCIFEVLRFKKAENLFFFLTSFLVIALC